MNRTSSIISIALSLLVVFAVVNLVLERMAEKEPQELQQLFIEGVEKQIEPGRKKIIPEEPPLVAIVLDDFGYSNKNLDELKGLDIPVTMAVLPNVPYSKTVCDFAKENGFEVILHMPMEPLDHTNAMENDTIFVSMDEASIKDKLSEALGSVYLAKGMSNHMGSKATGDERLMNIVFEDLKGRELFFLDSYTSGNSLCARKAEEQGVLYTRRDVFIDNQLDGEYISEQMRLLEKEAKEKGFAVGIGHDRPVTVKTLNKIVPGMKERGIRFVMLSELIERNK